MIQYMPGTLTISPSDLAEPELAEFVQLWRREAGGR